MSARPRIPLVLALAAAVLFGAASARATIVGDTVTIVTTSTPPPALRIDSEGSPYVAVASADGHRLFTKSGGVWTSQTITIAGNPGFFDFSIGPGRPALLRRGGAGHLILHRPDLHGIWDADTIPAPLTPPSGAVMSLALHPNFVDALATWMTNSDGKYRLWIARRTPSSWSIVNVDSSSDAFGDPSMVLTPTGQIRLAILRNLGPNGEGDGLYYLEADSELGPYVWSCADTSAFVEPTSSGNTASLALDPSTGEPRVTYKYAILHSYASRSGGVWTSQIIQQSQFLIPPGMSLALDPIGRPRILATELQIALADSYRAQQECGSVASHHTYILERDDPTGSDPFTKAFYLRGRDTGSRGLAMLGAYPYWVWRDSNGPNCLPAAIVLLHDQQTAAVPPGGARPSFLQLGPNPVRSGSVLNLRMSPMHEAPITLRIEDVAGRHVASRDHAGARGETAIAWTLPALRAGWYRVSARQSGSTLGTASFMVID